MADIDSIISGVGGNTRYDFSAFGDPVKSFFDANKQRAEFDTRRAFKDGVPTTADGQPDFGAMSKTLFQKGDVSQGIAAANLDLARQNMKFGQGQSQDIRSVEGGAQPQAPLVSPPSPNRSASTVVAPPLNKGGAISQGGPQTAPQAQGAPQGGVQGSATLGQVLTAQGIPNDQIGAASASIARQLGLEDPNAPLNMQDPQIRNVVVPAIQQLKRAGIGQVVPQQGPAPPQQPAPQAPQVPQGQPAPVTNAMTTTAAPATPSRNEQLIAYYAGVMSDPRSPKQNVELAKTRLETLQKNAEFTQPQKEYAQGVLQGFKGTLEDWQNRADSNTTQRDILTKSLLPKVDKSQESAIAARDDINAIHRSREQLDQNGGVFSGAFGDKMLYLSKVAEVLGVPNSDKITNTEAYGAAIGQRVAVMVKAFGSGTAISDGDRKFAANMAGGQVTLDETSMRRILDIGEKAARGKIENHNKLVDDVVGANDELKGARKSFIVEAPGGYVKAEQAARTAPKQQASTSVASKADYDKLPSGSTFTGPDGKPWRKP